MLMSTAFKLHSRSISRDRMGLQQKNCHDADCHDLAENTSCQGHIICDFPLIAFYTLSCLCFQLKIPFFFFIFRIGRDFLSMYLLMFVKSMHKISWIENIKTLCQAGVLHCNKVHFSRSCTVAVHLNPPNRARSSLHLLTGSSILPQSSVTWKAHSLREVRGCHPN